MDELLELLDLRFLDFDFLLFLAEPVEDTFLSPRRAGEDEVLSFLFLAESMNCVFDLLLFCKVLQNIIKKIVNSKLRHIFKASLRVESRSYICGRCGPLTWQ